MEWFYIGFILGAIFCRIFWIIDSTKSNDDSK